MKNILKFTWMVWIAAFVFAACSPQEFDEYSLGDIATINDSDFTFTATATNDPFVWNFEVTTTLNTLKNPYTFEVVFIPNNSKAVTKEFKSSWKYVELAGTYPAVCTFYAADGSIVSKTVNITLKEDNPEYFQDDTSSPQFILTGGKDNTNGKEWMLTGGSGLGPGNGTWGEWWNLNNEPALFNDVFIFKPNSIQPNGKFVYDNMGDTFMNESLGTLFPDGDPAGSFVTVNYTPATDATWVIETRNGVDWLIINKGFIGYPITADDLNKTEYEILSFTQSQVNLKYHSPDGNAWFFFLTSEEPQDVVDLTGGSSAANGKSWKWRPSADGAGVVMTRTWTGEVWWTIDATAAGSEAAYDDILTFYADGRVVYQNNGDSYMNESCGDIFSDGTTDGSFVTTEYVPSTSATWKFETKDDLPYLVMNNAFPMYGLNPDAIVEGYYELRSLSEDLLQISFVVGDDEWDVTWNYYLVPAN